VTDVTSSTVFVGKYFIALVLMLIPFSANAGFLSFMAGLFGGSSENVSLTGSVVNSQNISLLKAAVNSDPNPAKGGGEITIVGGTALLPEVGPSGTLAEIEDYSLSSGQISTYVVRPGDSLSQIAKMFGVSVNTIIWANDIRGSVIKEGQTLIILPISGVRHVVAKGDTLASIAKKYNANLDEMLQFNSFTEETAIAIDEVVIIPDGEMTLPKTYVKSATRVSYAGYYMRPLSGGIKTQGIHGYNAVDIATPVGTPIYASANGKVIISRDYGWNGGYGDYIVVAHDNGTQTLYSHLSKNIVSVGNWVIQGQVIGYSGSTGKSTGPHLHFEIRGAKNPF